MEEPGVVLVNIFILLRQALPHQCSGVWICAYSVQLVETCVVLGISLPAILIVSSAIRSAVGMLNSRTFRTAVRPPFLILMALTVWLGISAGCLAVYFNDFAFAFQKWRWLLRPLLLLGGGVFSKFFPLQLCRSAWVRTDLRIHDWPLLLLHTGIHVPLISRFIVFHFIMKIWFGLYKLYNITLMFV